MLPACNVGTARGRLESYFLSVLPQSVSVGAMSHHFSGPDLASDPANDAHWVETFAHSLEHSGNYAPEAAKRLANTLLPDIMPFVPGRPAVYPANGRGLTEDVIDHFLNLFTNGKVTEDGVGPHTDLLAEFPYLGPPHKV